MKRFGLLVASSLLAGSAGLGCNGEPLQDSPITAGTAGASAATGGSGAGRYGNLAGSSAGERAASTGGMTAQAGNAGSLGGSPAGGHAVTPGGAGAGPTAGGTQAGGTQAGGTQAGGTQAGGTQAGGTQAGGTQAGGGVGTTGVAGSSTVSGGQSAGGGFSRGGSVAIGGGTSTSGGPGSGGMSAGAGSGLGGSVAAGGSPVSGGASAAGGSSDGNGGDGTGGAQGGTAGQGGAASRVTFGMSMPVSFAMNHGLMIDVDSLDQAVLVAPRDPAATTDPGPAVRWLSPSGTVVREQTFAQGIMPEVMAVGPDDSIWMAGQLYRDASFGGSTLLAVEEGYYLLKLEPDGTHELSQAVATEETVWLQSMAVDPQGNVYLTGALHNYLVSNAPERAFVTKYSSAGTLLYTRAFPGTDSTAQAVDIAVAPSGDPVIAGYFNGTLDFGVQQLTSKATSGQYSMYNGFVAALNPGDGSARWARSFGGNIFDLANGVDVTPSGALRISGQLSGATEVCGMSTTAGADGAPFVAELTAEGAANWVQVLGERGIVFASDTDTMGRTYAVGKIPGADSSLYPMDGSSSLVASIANDGSVSFPMQQVTNANGAQGAAADRLGGLWLVGNFAGTVSFGNLTLTGPTSNNGGYYVLYLSP